jgi:hypothetical protein
LATAMSSLVGQGWVILRSLISSGYVDMIHEVKNPMLEFGQFSPMHIEINQGD